MKQVLRRGIGEMIVGEVPEPLPPAHHVLVHPLYSLISSGTETASIHQEGVLKEVANNPSHIRKILERHEGERPASGRWPKCERSSASTRCSAIPARAWSSASIRR